MPRQKVSAACNNCRRRKVKCDGDQPVCGPCQTRSEAHCVYSRGNFSCVKNRALLPRPRPSPNNVQINLPLPGGLSSRIGPPRQQQQQQIDRALPQSAVISPSTSAGTVGSTGSQVHAPSLNNAANTPITTMSNIKGSVTSSPRTRGSFRTEEFFGGASAASFTSQINTAIDARLGRSQPTTPGYNSVWPSRGKGTDPPQDDPAGDPLEYTLPQRTLADDLLQQYYALVWAIIPMHDWVLFQDAYESVWLGNPLPIPERIFHCMLNLAFALGSQFSQAIQPSKRRETGRSFWKKAQSLFDPRLHDSASHEGVQCLILMGLYLQTTYESHQCWMTVGAAIRMAQSLGLHLPSTTRRDATRREIEIPRRVWYGCVYMDRSLSITFGRPGMIADWQCNNIPMPAMIDDDLLDTDAKPGSVRPDGKPMAVAFFIKTLELYSIVSDSILELYMRPPDKASKVNPSIVSILQYDDRLVQFARSVPEQLRYDPNDTTAKFIYQRQRIVLRARYLYGRIVVLRPILAELCLKQRRPDTSLVTNQSLTECLIDRCATICFEAAHEMIGMIYQHLDLETVTGPTPAWWLGALFIYTAATVLLAQRIMPSDHFDAQICSPWPVNSSWHKAMKILRAYSRVGESAERCIAALEILSAKMQSHCQLIGRPFQQDPQVAADSHAVTSDQEGAPAAGGFGSSQQQQQQQQDATNGTNSVEQFGDMDEFSSTLVDLGDMDFNVEDMMWLNSSTADILLGMS